MMTATTGKKMMTFDAGSDRILHVGDEVKFLDTPFTIYKIMGTNQQMVRTTSNSEVNMNTRTKQPYKHNRLIEHWLINHRVSTVFRSIADLAEWAERELRFTITEANMQLVLRSMGIKFTRDMSIREKQIMVDTAIHQTSQVQDWKTFVKA